MSGERQVPLPIAVNLRGGVKLISTNEVRGITPSRELSPEKRAAIHETMAYILPSLTIDGKLKPRDDSGVLPYKTPTRFAHTISRRIPTLQPFAESHFTSDQSDQHFQDGAQLVRGITLGEVLVAAIVNDGRIVSTSHYQFRDAPAVTQTTSNVVEATNFAIKKTHDQDTATRILHALQLDTLGLSVDDVMGSILMSPVVVRFIEVPEARVDAYGGGDISPMIAAYAQVSALPYFAASPPFHIVEETTERWAEAFTSQFGFDIKDVYAYAKSLEESYLGAN